MSYELPSLEGWQTWRRALPAVPDLLTAVTVKHSSRMTMRAILAEVQRGDCALCLTAGKFLELDHDRHNGLVRGMLCKSCNQHEGHCRWSDEHPVLSAYRSNPPAVDTGWIWDSSARLALARVRAAGQVGGGISVIAPIELLADAWTFRRHEW